MQLQLYGKKILLYRRAIDGLTNLIINDLHCNPQEGVYLFFNRKRDKIKGLSWHKNGFLLFYKRLDKFHFNFNKTTGSVDVQADVFEWLLAGLEWQKMESWKDLNYNKFL